MVTRQAHNLNVVGSNLTPAKYFKWVLWNSVISTKSSSASITCLFLRVLYLFFGYKSIKINKWCDKANTHYYIGSRRKEPLYSACNANDAICKYKIRIILFY